MRNKLSDILHQTVGVEISSINDRNISYSAKISLIMRTEIDFSLIKNNKSEEFVPKDVPIAEGDSLIVILKTPECRYNYVEKCTYVKKTPRTCVISVRSPVSLSREQKRGYVRVPINELILISDMPTEEKQELQSAVPKIKTETDADIDINQKEKDKNPKDLLINPRQVESSNLSGGGIAFYSKDLIKSKSIVLVDLGFIAPKLKGIQQQAKVLRCLPTKNRRNTYIVSAQFIKTSFVAQQGINNYVFAQIREETRRKKGLD